MTCPTSEGLFPFKDLAYTHHSSKDGDQVTKSLAILSLQAKEEETKDCEDHQIKQTSSGKNGRL